MSRTATVNALELQNVTKGLYDTAGRTISNKVIVLDSASFNVRPGEVHVLLGENGAGKSTLMKILCGAVPADSGRILIRGVEVRIDQPAKALALGVSLVAQEFSLCPNLTVCESMFVGREPVKGPLQTIDMSALREQTRQALARLDATIDPDMHVRDLTVPQQQMVEIAKALSHNPQILIMDEPTAALADDQVDHLFKTIRQLKQQGVSIIYISHRLAELHLIGDRVTVLRDGRTIGTLEIAEASLDTLIQMMVGRAISNLYPRDPQPPGDVALEVSHLSRQGKLYDVSLHVRSGEIVGLAGIVGAGRTELVRAVFGADPYDSGVVKVYGKVVEADSCIRSIRAGIGLLPEDRQRQGVVPLVSVADNVVHVAMDRLAKLGWIGPRRRRELARGYIEQLDMAVASPDQEARFLSGGTQQKLVLAKWLCGDSQVLIFDEPTRGIDVGSKSAIHGLMNDLANQGAAILMISSELPEVLGMSDRIYVMHKGRIVAERMRGETNSEEIIGFAMGRGEVVTA